MAVFKNQRTFAQSISATEEDTEKTMMQFWKDYNICDCIQNLIGLGVMSPRSV
jgi:hypothetical protein